MRRLYTFGCSYTENRYPTYADYLAPYFDIHYNFGSSGSGNRSIFAKLGKLLAEGEITDMDTVIVQWSSIPREDRIFDKKWIAGGVINNSHIYSDEWIEQYFTYTQQTIELISYIRTIIPAIKDVTKEFKWFYMLEPWFEDNLGEPGFNGNTNFQEKYKDLKKTNLIETLKSLSGNDYLGGIENFYIESDILTEKDRKLYYCDDNFQASPDDHPPQIMHLMFSELILDSLGYQKFYYKDRLTENAKKWTEYLQDPERMINVERDYYKKTGEWINYFKQQHLGSPEWPTNNSIKGREDV